MRGFNSIRLRLIWLSAIAVASMFPTSFAQTVDMLEIEPDSRVSGMGYAGVSSSRGANAMFWNPAALVGEMDVEVSLTRFKSAPDWSDTVLHDFVVRYQHWKSSAFAAGIKTVHWDYAKCRDGTPGCSKQPWDLALTGSYALKINGSVSLGGSFKYLYLRRWAHDYDLPEAVPGNGFGLDLAARFETGYTDILGRASIISVGATLTGIGPSIRYGRPIQRNAKLPTYLRFGWSVLTKLDGIRSIEVVNEIKLPLVHRDADVEGRRTLFERIAIGFGVEYVPDDLLVFRAGFQAGNYLYSLVDRQIVTFGAGIRHKIVRLDAAYAKGIRTEQQLTAGGVRFTLGIVV